MKVLIRCAFMSLSLAVMVRDHNVLLSNQLTLQGMSYILRARALMGGHNAE